MPCFFSPLVLESANSKILYPKEYTLREISYFDLELNILPESEPSQMTQADYFFFFLFLGGTGTETIPSF